MMNVNERTVSLDAQRGHVASQGQSSLSCQLFDKRPSISSDLDSLLGIYNEQRRPTDPSIANCTWQDVLDKMQVAQASYQQKGQKSTVRGFFRHGKSMRMVVTPLLEVIPEDYGLRALKGGLTLLFSCLAERQENVEKILRCFEDVPLVMENARETLEIFHRNPKLCDHVWDLYHALITGMPGLIQILLGKSDSKWRARFRNKIPSEQERLIAETISTVENAKRKPSDYAETLGYQSIADIEQTTTKTAGQVSAMRLDLREMSTDLKLEFRGVMQGLVSVNRNVIELREEAAQQRKQIADIARQTETIQGMLGAVYQLGQEALNPTAPVRQIAAPSQANSRYHAAFLSSVCGCVDPKDCIHAAADIKSLLGKRYHFDEESIGASRWLMTSKRFQDWLNSPNPGALVVHSYTDMLCEGKTSAMSLFSATLASALMQGEHVIVSSFFCGLHSDRKDTFCGPIGMLRSMIFQILLTQGASEPNDAALLQDLEAGILKAFAYAFRQCVAQLPAGTRVFCIIDAANVYETRMNGWKSSLHEAFRILRAVVSDTALGSIFKLLVTTPTRSDTILQGLGPIGNDQLFSTIDMSAGEVDYRPLTVALIADMVGKGRF